MRTQLPYGQRSQGSCLTYRADIIHNHLDQARRGQMIADVSKAEPRGDRDGARAGGEERGLGDAKAAAALKRDTGRIGIIMRVGLVRIVKDRIANRIIKPNGLIDRRFGVAEA
jgi:hypothetical protein